MSLLRRMAWAAAVAGIAGGLLLSALQAVWVVPLIHQAETYEDAAGAPQGDAAGAWAPEAGLQRTALTLISNVIAGVAFALLLAAGMSLRGGSVDALTGLVWGGAGYASFVLAPALGLPPDLPGKVAGALELRQLWWLGAALATAAGLAVIAFAPGWMKLLGVLPLLLPQAISTPDVSAATGHALPSHLAAHFVAAVLVTSAVFWSVLGALCGWALGRHASREDA